jgi:8-oxo-dGTP diphosphatase
MPPVTPDTRHLTASMVVLDPEISAVLLVHHKAADRWVFPGGHLDPNETLAECAVRETLEETGLETVIFDSTGVDVPGADWHPSPWMTAAFPAPAKPHKNEPAHTHIDHLFIGFADSRLPLKIAEGEVRQAQWVRVAVLHNLPNLRDEVLKVAWLALDHLGRSGL